METEDWLTYRYKTMHVGLLTHNYPQTKNDRKDAGIFIYDFAHELAKKHNVSILCPNFTGGNKEDYHKVSVTWFKWAGGDSKLGQLNLKNLTGIYWFFSLIYCGCQAAEKFVRENRIEYILSAWSFPSGLFAMYASWRLKVPYATWSLGSDINIYAQRPVFGIFIKQILIHARCRFANSYFLCDKVKQLSGSDCFFLPAITDFKITKIQSLKLNQSQRHFLFVGRLEKVKGPDILIEACRLLQNLNSRFMVHILGDGSLRKILEEQCLPNVYFHGNSSKNQVAQYMAVADFLVIPSRSESLPLVLIEAAKVRLPIIASRVGDCQRLVDDYHIGYTVDPENSSNLAQVMRQAIQKSDKSVYLPGLKRIAREFIQSEAVRIFTSSVKDI